MPTLSFEGETQGELVAKVRRWLASVEGEDRPLSAAEAIHQSAEITKDALRVIASSAPGPVRESEIVKGLTAMGYQVTDASSKLLVDALDALSNVTGGGLLRSAGDAGAKVMFEMNQAVAKQLLKSLRGARK